MQGVLSVTKVEKNGWRVCATLPDELQKKFDKFPKCLQSLIENSNLSEYLSSVDNLKKLQEMK